MTVTKPSNHQTLKPSNLQTFKPSNLQTFNRSIIQLLEQVPCDHDPLDLRGALPDLADLGVPHHALDRVILGVPIAAVHLNRLDRGAHRELGAEELRHRGLLRKWPTVLGQPGRVKHQVLPRLDLRGDVGELELDPLEARDGLAELLAGIRVPQSLLESAFRNAERK